MISVARGRFTEILRAAAPPALVVTSTDVLLHFPPAQNCFYPECPIYRSLHLLCPGCGATRALAALLHGHFGKAMYFNGLTTVLLPIAVISGVRWYCRYVRREADHWPQIPRVALYATLAAAMMFTVARNLPLGQLR